MTIVFHNSIKCLIIFLITLLLNVFVFTHKESVDNIDESSIEYKLENNSLVIKWDEPLKPNGAVITFNIEVKERKNKRYFEEKEIFCLNYWQYKYNGNSFTINNLNLNNEYSFRLRVNSMAGAGNWTRAYYFNSTGSPLLEMFDSEPVVVFLTTGLTVLLIAFVLTATVCYLRAPKRSNSQLDIISVNPEYEKFIVDPEWEVRKEDIKMFQTLGDGAFGCVSYGELRKGGKIIKCAVKTLKPTARSQERDDFLKEANIMKSFTECHHIVKLLGIVSIENPVLVLMEYMVNGDLKTYLRFNRPDSDENPNPRVPTWPRIFQMAIEISDGMLYLAANRFVHRDLAARNCMVAVDLTVKIGDFGMTRDIYDHEYYRKKDNGLLPVRWMSPESLKDNIFTTYSDIWAYGVVLWEIVTLGAQPYQGQSHESVIQSVIRGLRLTQPDNCPKKLWTLMEFCWRKHPKMRPGFDEIIQYLMPSANQSFREVCYYLNRKSNPLTKPLSIKKIIYSLVPTHRLLNNYIKPNAEVFEQIYFEEKEIKFQHYCPMKPTIEQNDSKTNEESNEEQMNILNHLDQQSVEVLNNCLNVKAIEETEDSKEPNIMDCFA